MDVFVLGAIALVVIGAIVFLALRKKKSLPLPKSFEMPRRDSLVAPDLRIERATMELELEHTPTAKTMELELPPSIPAPPVPAAAKISSVPPRGQPTPSGIVTSQPSRAEEVAHFKKGLSSTRQGLVARIAQLLAGQKQIAPELLEPIEEALIGADIGTKTTEKILAQLRESLARNELRDPEQVWSAIGNEAKKILGTSGEPLQLNHKPSVILVVGVNGAGKTTTIGKLASQLSQEKKVLLVAADTFRAAAVLQLEVWGRRVGCPVVKGKEHGDPSSVVFEAIQQAQAQNIDVVIVDTAGRLHTKAPLMEELQKVHRTTAKALGGREPDEILLVLDCTNGQNAVQQAKLFQDAVPLTGVVLTKVDGTAKGGVVLAIVDEHQIPVRYLGFGEKIEDLRLFDAASFAEALFESKEGASAAA